MIPAYAHSTPHDNQKDIFKIILVFMFVSRQKNKESIFICVA